MDKKEKRQIIEKNKELLKRYPILTPSVYFHGGMDYDYTYTELDFVCIGWQKMFLEMCDEIQSHLKEVGVPFQEFWFYDIKEKWGGLRVQAGGYSDDAIESLLSDAETRSLLFCPHCGKPTKYVTHGYVLYLCEDCFKEAKLNGEPLTADDAPVFREWSYDKEGKVTTSVKPSRYDADFRSQWNGKKEG